MAELREEKSKAVVEEGVDEKVFGVNEWRQIASMIKSINFVFKMADFDYEFEDQFTADFDEFLNESFH